MEEIYEVKAWHAGDPKTYELMRAHRIVASSPLDAARRFYLRLEQPTVRQILELRVNHLGSYQGHYYSPEYCQFTLEE
jgi:hypothetical protein